MNGLRDMLYGQPGQAASGPTVGADFGFNIGNETFRVQLAVAGLFLAALLFIVWMHKKGHRFSVKVD